MTRNLNQSKKFAIVYIGAPYGNGEGGHLDSTYATAWAADQHFAKKFGGNTGRLNNVIVDLDVTDVPRWQPTPRQYFAD